MSIKKFNQKVVANSFAVSRGDKNTASEIGVRYVASAVFDASALDSAGVANTAIGAHGLGVFLPKNAIITKFWYDVITTFTSATDAATIATSVESANDGIAAIAISNATNMWDAGLHAGKIGFPSFGLDAAHDTQAEVAALFAGAFLKLTAEREVTATVAVEVLTAGKAVFYFEYVLGAL